MRIESLGSPEVALLLASSSGDPSRDSVRRLMAGRINWEHLTRLAVDSHATPGLWEVISCFPDLPTEAGTLQAIAVVNDFRRFHIRSLTTRVSKQLEQAGIEVMALKGAALLCGAVTKPTSRTMNDIDLLVIRGSPEEAWGICRSNGWTPIDKSATPELYRDHHHLAPLQDPEGVFIGLELHRTLLPGLDRLGVDTKAIVSRSRVVTVGDVSVRVPSVEDLLLHSCLHFAWSNKLRRGAWRAFADAHSIIADPQFSWDQFLRVVATTSRRAKQSCYWTLRLGRVVAELRVPDEVLGALDPRAGGMLARLLERHFTLQLVDPASDASVAQRARRWLWFSALRESSTSDEADVMWNEGAVDVPVKDRMPPRPQRGALRAALTTCGYFARLVARA